MILIDSMGVSMKNRLRRYLSGKPEKVTDINRFFLACEFKPLTPMWSVIDPFAYDVKPAYLYGKLGVISYNPASLINREKYPWPHAKSSTRAFFTSPINRRRLGRITLVWYESSDSTSLSYHVLTPPHDVCLASFATGFLYDVFLIIFLSIYGYSSGTTDRYRHPSKKRLINLRGDKMPAKYIKSMACRNQYATRPYIRKPFQANTPQPSPTGIENAVGFGVYCFKSFFLKIRRSASAMY
jgi:hypothetical protein